MFSPLKIYSFLPLSFLFSPLMSTMTQSLIENPIFIGVLNAVEPKDEWEKPTPGEIEDDDDGEEKKKTKGQRRRGCLYEYGIVVCNDG